MKSTVKLSVFITLAMLAAAACVPLGKSIINIGGGLTLEYNYIESLFPAADTAFLSTTTIYSWILVISGVLTSALVWIKGAWSTLVAACVCASSIIYHFIRSFQNNYNPFQIDGPWELAMLALPLVALVLCVALYRVKRDV